MPKKYDGPINRHTDFTHAGPNGEPASGLSVQTYIKGIDARKYGIGYTLEDGSAHLFFADEEDMLAYQADPTQTQLIKDRIELQPPYTIELQMLTPSFNPVFLGAKGNYIRFNFSTVTRSGNPYSESVTVTLTIIRGSSTRDVTENYRPGATVAFNMDDYLAEGTNTVNIKVKGQETGVATNISVTFQVINLVLEDTFDISTVNTIAAAGQTLPVSYNVIGSGPKMMEWYVDGVRVPYNSDEDDINEASSMRTKYISLDGLEQGRHSLQFRVAIQVSGEMFYSEVHYREFIVDRGNDLGDAVAVLATEFPSSVGVLGPSDTLVVYAKQYETLNLRVAAWNPDGTYRNTVTASSGAIQLASTVCTEGQESQLPVVFSTAGSVAVTLAVAGVTRAFTLSVAETDMDIQEITNGLELGFSAQGRTNDSANKDSWTDGTHNAIFAGFDWIATSGWNNGKLVVPSGASVAFDYAPLAQDATTYGKTIELDFKTVNVNDEDAVLIDMTNNDGVGVKLTATEVIVKSAQGVELSRHFKTDEDLRISIVINPHTGATNRNLLFVYFNGIISMAAPFAATDNFISSANLSVGGVDAGIVLKQIRVYNQALPSASVLNNYILYQDTIADMTALYEKNDLYEEGTNNFDIDKIAAYLPVMIITGNIPAIENTTDKSLQIVADIRYINLQDTTRSFTMRDAIVTGQGTSSMTYPKKNLRIYTTKSDQTVLLDYEGNVVANRLYSFKEGAQPVNCWCLKTDFAESSGTHNTGVARLWNEVLKNAKVNDEYVLRTEAQQLAADEHYPYDVRTAIDGFPIVVFYHLTENAPLIFLGKYNFNNDKSTESVFGFTQFIEDFDNSKVECWEFLDSGNTFALFQTTEGWNDTIIDGTKQKKKWELAWEARYPDKNKNTTALKTLADWLVSTQGDLQEWVDNKAAHFDLPKLAAYYVYLMRHGAVDQTVKNSMITTEDGVHWYFILYDNDTVHGVRNDGLLRYSPEIDRQSTDPELSRPGDPYYCYAGHGSVLWNNFEADDECMLLAKQIDAALYSAGLTYEKAIQMFNERQAGKWAEAIYNQDAQYKYIGPYVNQGLRYLGSLQGSRSDHRKWWLSNRYAFFDAFFVNGAYTGKNIHFLAPSAPAGTTFSIKAGKRFYFGYSRDSVIQESGVLLDEGETHNFVTTQGLEIGTAIRIFAPYNISELDISDFIEYVNASNFDLSAAYDPVLGTKMKKLVLGDANHENNALDGLSGLENIITLEELNIEGYKAILSLDLSTLINLKKLHANASGLRSVTFANGAPLELIELPSTLQSLTIKNNANINNFGVLSENDFANVRSMRIENCPKLLGTSQRSTPVWEARSSIVKIWLEHVALSNYADCELYIDGFNFELSKGQTNTLYTAIRDFKLAGGNVTIKGRIKISVYDNWTQEELEELQAIWGENIFNKNASLYFYSDTPIMFISGPDLFHYGDTVQYVPKVIGIADDARFIYRLSSTYQDFLDHVSIDTNGRITSTEVIIQSGSNSGTLSVQYVGGGQTATITKTIYAYNRRYPSTTNAKLTGVDNDVYSDKQSTFSVVPVNASTILDGFYTTVFSATGSLAQYLTITKVDDNHCTVIVDSNIPDIVSNGTLVATITRNLDQALCCELSFGIFYQDSTIAISALKNPEAVRVLYNAGLCASQDYMLKSEAEVVGDAQLVASTYSAYYKSIFNIDQQFRENCTNFDELKYFTLLTKVPHLAYCYSIEHIELPPNVLEVDISNTAFTNEMLYIPNTATYVNISGSRILGLDLTDFAGYVTYQGFNNIRLEKLYIGSGTKFRALSGPPLENGMAQFLQEVRVDAGNEWFEEGNNLLTKDSSKRLYFLGSGEQLPDGVKSIGQYAACDGRYTYQVLDLKNTVETLNGSAFYYCDNIKSIINCAGLKYIYGRAFQECSNLETIAPLSDLQTIGSVDSDSSIFRYCSKVKTLTIGDKITTIGKWAFMDMTGLESITILATTPPTAGVNMFSRDTALESIYVPAAAVEDYKAASNWSDYASLIKPIPED